MNNPKCFSLWEELLLLSLKAKRSPQTTGYVKKSQCQPPLWSILFSNHQKGFSALLPLPSGSALQMTLFVFLHLHPGRLTWS